MRQLGGEASSSPGSAREFGEGRIARTWRSLRVRKPLPQAHVWQTVMSEAQTPQGTLPEVGVRGSCRENNRGGPCLQGPEERSGEFRAKYITARQAKTTPEGEVTCSGLRGQQEIRPKVRRRLPSTVNLARSTARTCSEP